jgi:PAT family acetyl-CoA transporter-like MFS transporter 1
MAARWSTAKNVLRPWLWAYWSRLGFAALNAAIVYRFPASPIGAGVLVVLGVLGRTFVCVVGHFHLIHA